MSALVKRLFLLALAGVMILVAAGCTDGYKSDSDNGSDSRGPTDTLSGNSSSADTSNSSAADQSGSDGDHAEVGDTAVFALGADGQDEQTMGIGDRIGEWTLTDLQIQYDGDTVSRLDALFGGTVTLEGVISRSPFGDASYQFVVAEKDESKMPCYISPDMDPKDSFVFMLDIPEDMLQTLELDQENEIACRITIGDYRFVYAEMMAPSTATVVDIEVGS